VDEGLRGPRGQNSGEIRCKLLFVDEFLRGSRGQNSGEMRCQKPTRPRGKSTDIISVASIHTLLEVGVRGVPLPSREDGRLVHRRESRRAADDGGDGGIFALFSLLPLPPLPPPPYPERNSNKLCLLFPFRLSFLMSHLRDSPNGQFSAAW